MSKLLARALVRVNTATGGVAGTGFLVCGKDERAYVITCAHVVNAALRGRAIADRTPLPPDAAVTLSCSPTPARVLHWIAPVAVGAAKASPVADIAVLDPGLPPDPSWPVLRSEPAAQVTSDGDVAFDGFGFMGPQDGLPVKGVLRAVDQGGWFVARAHEGFGTFIEEGLSGAPLLDASRRVLGMAVQRHGKEGSSEGLVIPAMALAQAWPPLANPYVGLRSFQAETAHLFFGRDAAVDGLRARLRHQPVVAVVGDSGSGKSSLVRAGLVPRMAAERWRAVVFEPKQHPVAQWADAIARQAEPGLSGPELLGRAETWRASLRDGRLEPALDTLGKGAAGVLFVVDQFEQFFTADADRADAVAADLGLILRMLRDAARRDDVRVVLTLRIDLMSRVLAQEAAGALMRDPLPPFVLDRMRPAEIREAIVGGAALFQVDVDPGLATAFAADAAAGEGRLPLLQSALSDLYRFIERRNGRWMLSSPGSVTTGLSDAIQAVANEAVASLESGRRGPPVPAETIDRVLSSLVRLTGPKQIATKRILPGPAPGAVVGARQAQDWAVVQRLAAERLVILGDAGGAPTAELAHDRLIDQWPRLAALIENDRKFLGWLGPVREFQAPAWVQAGRGAARVLTGSDLAMALDYAATRADDLEPDELAFIEASQDERLKSVIDLQAQLQRETEAHAQAEQSLHASEQARSDAERARRDAERARRNTQRALRAVGVVAGALFIVAGLAWGGFQEAQSERDQAQLAQSRVLARQSDDALYAGDALQAYLIAAQADDWREPTARPEARAARLAAGATLLGRRVSGIDPAALVAGFSEAATVAYGVGPLAQAWSIDLPGARATALEIPRPEGAIVSAASLDGSRLLLTNLEKGVFRVFDRNAARTADLPWQRVPPPGDASTMDLELRALVESRQSELVEVDLDTGQRRTIASAPNERPYALAGDTLLTTPDRTEPGVPLSYRVRQTHNAETFILDAGVRPLTAGMFGAEFTILTADPQNTLALWTVDPAQRKTLAKMGGAIWFGALAPDRSAAFVWVPEAADGRYAIIRAQEPEREPETFDAARAQQGRFSADGSRLLLVGDRTMWVRDVGTERMTAPISIGGRAAPSMSADGRWLVSGGGNGELLIWDLDVLLDPGRAAALMEPALRERLADKSASCLDAERMAALGLQAPSPGAPSPHACPIGVAGSPGSRGFWRELFRAVAD